jgi:hypothetical protein
VRPYPLLLLVRIKEHWFVLMQLVSALSHLQTLPSVPLAGGRANFSTAR